MIEMYRWLPDLSSTFRSSAVSSLRRSCLYLVSELSEPDHDDVNLGSDSNDAKEDDLSKSTLSNNFDCAEIIQTKFSASQSKERRLLPAVLQQHPVPPFLGGVLICLNLAFDFDPPGCDMRTIRLLDAAWEVSPIIPFDRQVHGSFVGVLELELGCLCPLNSVL
jgi:hypothetical protein